MKEKEMIEVLRELYRLWNMEGTDEDIDFILNVVIQKIGK